MNCQLEPEFPTLDRSPEEKRGEALLEQIERERAERSRVLAVARDARALFAGYGDGI